MKKTLFYITLVYITAIIVVVSCNKPSYNKGNVITVTKSLNQLFAGLRTTPQGLSVEAGRDTIVFGAHGTMLHFYTNSFKDASGNMITSGTINLQLVEMYKPGDMIANRATTMAGSQLLRSGGQIDVSAKMNGLSVSVTKYGLGFIQAARSGSKMALFYGNTNNGDSVANWAVSDTSQEGNIANGADTATHNVIDAYGRSWVGYVFDSASTLSYTNCDAFYYNDSPKTSVSVIMQDTSFNPQNTQVYLVLPDINCAMSTIEPYLGSAGWDATTHTISLISEGQKDIVPAGMNYKLIVISNKNGQYYYWQSSGTIPHNGINTNATLAADTQANVLAQLSAL